MPEQEKHPKTKTKARKKAGYLPLILIIVITFIVAIAAYALMWQMPNFRTVPFYDYHSNLHPNDIHIIRQDQLLDLPHPPLYVGNEMYIPVDFIKEHIDPYIFWDVALSKLTITTENKVIRMKTEDLTYFVNSEPMTLQLPVYEQNQMAFLPLSFVTDFYGVSFTFEEIYNLLMLDLDTDEFYRGITTEKKTRIRYDADKKSPIAVTAPPNMPLIVYREHGEYSKVRTPEGVVGFVLTKHIEKTEKVEAAVRPVSQPPAPIEGKLNIAWEMSKTLYDLAPPELDVISPVWFSFANTDGDIVNQADKSYVEFAHEHGYQVWPAITDNFDPALCYEILSNTDKREHIIKQLLAFISIYELDGINIDFEAVRPDNAENFLQFMRELSPYMKQQGAILSVDMFVPLYTRYYNRTELAKTVDYMMVMAYDEHHNSSPVSGPVASINFVETGIKSTLEEVPNEKVVLGLPYYVRIWREEQGDELLVTTRNVGMNFARRIFTEAGATFEWLEDLACYYAEYDVIEDGNPVKYRVWLEDLRSIEEKLKLVQKYDLAGVAGWQKGLEAYEVWALLEQYLK